MLGPGRAVIGRLGIVPHQLAGLGDVRLAVVHQADRHGIPPVGLRGGQVRRAVVDVVAREEGIDAELRVEPVPAVLLVVPEAEGAVAARGGPGDQGVGRVGERHGDGYAVHRDLRIGIVRVHDRGVQSRIGPLAGRCHQGGKAYRDYLLHLTHISVLVSSTRSVRFKVSLLWSLPASRRPARWPRCRCPPLPRGR